jgi:hypothetical protein
MLPDEALARLRGGHMGGALRCFPCSIRELSPQADLLARLLRCAQPHRPLMTLLATPRAAQYTLPSAEDGFHHVLFPCQDTVRAGGAQGEACADGVTPDRSR